MGCFRLFLPFDGIATNRYQSALLFYPAATPKAESRESTTLARTKDFTNETVAALAATGKRYEVRDPLCPGLRVAVQPSGAKSFVVRYSHDGKYRKLDSWRMAEGQACRVGRRKARAIGTRPEQHRTRRPKSSIARQWRPRRPAQTRRRKNLNSAKPRPRTGSRFGESPLAKVLGQADQEGQSQTSVVAQAVRAVSCPDAC